MGIGVFVRFRESATTRVITVVVQFLDFFQWKPTDQRNPSRKHSTDQEVLALLHDIAVAATPFVESRQVWEFWIKQVDLCLLFWFVLVGTYAVAVIIRHLSSSVQLVDISHHGAVSQPRLFRVSHHSRAARLRHAHRPQFRRAG